MVSFDSKFNSNINDRDRRYLVVMSSYSSYHHSILWRHLHLSTILLLPLLFSFFFVSSGHNTLCIIITPVFAFAVSPESSSSSSSSSRSSRSATTIAATTALSNDADETVDQRLRRQQWIQKYITPFQLEIFEETRSNVDLHFLDPTKDDDDNDNNDNDYEPTTRISSQYTYRGIRTVVDRSISTNASNSGNDDDRKTMNNNSIIMEIPQSQIIVATDFDIDTITPHGMTTTEKDALTEEQIIALGILSLRDSNNDDTCNNNDNDSTTTTITDQQDRRIYVNHILPKIDTNYYDIWSIPEEIWTNIIAPTLPRCYRESFQATRNHVHDEFVQRILSAQQLQGRDNHNNNNNMIRDYTKDELQWAFSMVRSRSVAVPELVEETNRVLQEEAVAATATAAGQNQVTVELLPPPLAIIPGLDLLNHRFSSSTAKIGTQLNFDVNHQNWVISMTVPATSSSTNDNTQQQQQQHATLQKGDEIFLSYGDEKDNWKLVLTYGFVVRNNPNQFVFFTWEDILQSAQHTNPTIFTDQTIQALMKHPGLQNYVILSEHRATASFDATTNQPRESLINALVTITNLASQLGGGETEGLSEMVQKDLIQRRIVELDSGLHFLNQHRMGTVQQGDDDDDKGGKHFIPLEWQPFVDSVKTALEEERRALNNCVSNQHKTQGKKDGSSPSLKAM